jgi:uncharacterized membrane protein YgcG
LLILIVPAKNAARIEVGYGLEGSIPDARASIYVNDFLLSLQASGAAGGLSILLDKIEDALPQGDQKPQARNVLDEHPEWKLPFVLVVFSPFAIFPLIGAISMSSFPGMRSSAKSLTLPPFAVCCAALVSAALLATMYGFAAWSLWGSNKAGYVAAVLAFALPLLWSLNTCTHERLGPVARCGLIIGNLCVVLMFFAIITLFVGMGLSVAQLKEVWAAPLFAALLAVGLAVFLFPGRPATVLMLFLRSYGHFIIALVVAYSALQPIHAQPAPLAFGAAALFTALAAIGLYLDSRETKASPVGERVATRRWSVWFFVAAILVFVPFVVVTLIHAVLGDDFYTRIVQLSAGGGSIAAVIWWLARQGFFSLVIGLGGKFGGGGAGRDG